MPTANCPSGLIIDVSGLKGIDFRYLGNEQILRDNDVERFLFEHHCHTVLDEGAYDFKGRAPDWSQVYLSDMVYLLIAIRNATYPPPEHLYPLVIRCPNRTCKEYNKKTDWDIDLGKFLEERAVYLPAEHVATLHAGERFTTTVPEVGNNVSFRPKTLTDRQRFNAIEAANKKKDTRKSKERENSYINDIIFHGVQIDGVDPKNRDQKQDFLESLELRQLEALKGELEKYECVFDTQIGVKCMACDVEWEVGLPLNRHFFTMKRSPNVARGAVEKVTNDSDDSI